MPRKEFTLLEKDIFLIENPQSKNCIIQIPNIETCICLIMWHQNLCAIIHANGMGNEVAAYHYMIKKFEERNIKFSDVRVHMIGGFYNQKYSNFGKEFLFWATGYNSNAIAHPMLQVLKEHQFRIIQKQHTSNIEGTFFIMFNASDISSLRITSDNVDSSTYLPLMKNELYSRGESIQSALARVKSHTTTYQVFEIGTLGDIGDLDLNYRCNTASNNCGESCISWFPHP